MTCVRKKLLTLVPLAQRTVSRQILVYFGRFAIVRTRRQSTETVTEGNTNKQETFECHALVRKCFIFYSCAIIHSIEKYSGLNSPKMANNVLELLSLRHVPLAAIFYVPPTLAGKRFSYRPPRYVSDGSSASLRGRMCVLLTERTSKQERKREVDMYVFPPLLRTVVEIFSRVFVQKRNNI